MHSWKQYCKVTAASNAWNAVYRLATSNITVTTDPADTTPFMIDCFTPEDDEEMDNERHKLIWVQIKEPTKTEDGKLFTPVEITDAIGN